MIHSSPAFVQRPRMDDLEPRTLLSSAVYVRHDLVSDNAVAGTRTDANLVNAWGLASSPTGPWWVNANGKDVTIALDGTGHSPAASFAIPTVAGQSSANPTGIVFNPTGKFTITSGTNNGASEYLIVTESGTVAGWNPSVDAANAVVMVNHSSAGAVYKGAALGGTRRHTFLFVANFHAGRIEMFDSSFNSLRVRRTAFRDTSLPAGYAPFNVADINGLLYVAYAKQDAQAHDDVAGPGHGFLDIFTIKGALVKRFASTGVLDSPWAVVKAPADFGAFSNDVLVGNFGNGLINVFSPRGRFLGQISDAKGTPIDTPGLWGLAFGNGSGSGPSNALYFSAGPGGEAHGLFGDFAAA